MDMYDFGARYYDPTLATWHSIDPLAEGSPDWSPYNYVGDNPVNIMDPDGMQPSNTTHIPFWGSEAGFGAGWNIAGTAGGAVAAGLSIPGLVNKFTPGFSSVQNFSGLGSVQGNGVGVNVPNQSNNSIISKGLNIISKAGIPILSSSAHSGLELQQGHYVQAGIDEVTALIELFTWESAVKYKIPSYNSAIPTTEKAIVTKGTQYARITGMAGEDAVGISGPKESINVGGKIRIPDRLTRTALEEVKNVKSLSFTRQLRDFSAFSQQNGLKFILYTRPNTALSAPLQQAIKNELIFQRFIPGL